MKFKKIDEEKIEMIKVLSQDHGKTGIAKKLGINISTVRRYLEKTS